MDGSERNRTSTPMDGLNYYEDGCEVEVCSLGQMMNRVNDFPKGERMEFQSNSQLDRQYCDNLNSKPSSNGKDTSRTPKLETRLSSNDVNLLELVFLTSFNFPYGLICGTFGLWILPAEAQRLFPLMQSLTLGLSLGIVGLAQLVCPIAGKISDFHVATTRFGKRRPFLIWGCIVGSISTIGMWKTSLSFHGLLYYFFLFTGMTGLNVAYAVNCGLVPDFLDDNAQGKSSGLVAVHTLLGSGTGFALVLIAADKDFHFVYPIYIFLLSLACGLTWFTSTQLEIRLNDYESVKQELQFAVLRRSTDEMSTMTIDSAAESSLEMLCDGECIQVSHRNSGALANYRRRSENQLSTSLNAIEDTPSTEILMTPVVSTAESTINFGKFGSYDLQVAKLPSTDQVLPLRHLSSQSSAEMTTSNKTKSRSHYHASQNERKTPTSSSHHIPLQYHDPENIATVRRSHKMTLLDILQAFKMDTSGNYDFFWVFMGRTLYYIGVSVQAFMLYYLRDVVGTETESNRRFQLGCIALLAQAMAACVAYPIGKYTDECNVGKKPLIYIACGTMSGVYLGFLFSPVFGNRAFLFVLCTAMIYGAGNGCFLAVDYALALATIPNQESTTQALGIWGVSAFIGSAIGPLLWGSVIEAFGRDAITDHYQYIGYAAMLFGGIVATIGAGAVIKLVKGVH